MPKWRTSRIGRGLIAAALVFAGALASLPGARAGVEIPPPVPPAVLPASPDATTAIVYTSGAVQYSTIINCVSIIQGLPYAENGIGAYVGQALDPDAGQPVPNQVYYLKIVVASLGNACSGQRVFIDLQLPSNTSLAISGSNPVVCYYDNTPQTCPQSLPSSAFNPGAFSLLSGDLPNANTWPMPQGRFFTAYVPVVSSAVLSGLPFVAHIRALDGNDNPWLRPQVGVYVFGSAPTFAFDVPSTISITTNTGFSYGYLYSFGLGGDVYFDWGTTPGYGTSTLVGTVGPGAYRITQDWLDNANQPMLTPDTPYYWRLRLVGANAQTYSGAGQSFRTLAGDRATIGAGSPGGCTEAALRTELEASFFRTVTFNCGALPVTITLTAPITIATGQKTIDGGNKVTLVAATGQRHFRVSTVGKLILKNTTLSGGSTSDCGGAIFIESYGATELIGSRLMGNTSGNRGGALCLDVGANALVSATLVASNTAVSGGGGIWIGASATAELFYSDISNNVAGQYGAGGGVGSFDPATLAATRSLFQGNRAYLGGAISVVGTVLLYASTVSGNTASENGGGISGDPFLSNATVAGNVAGDACVNCVKGGGVYGNATLQNSILAGNFPNNCPKGSFVPVVFSNGHNISSDNSCGLTALNDRNSLNPRLLPLTMNGGRTRTHALDPLSPAINAGKASFCASYGCRDQREVPAKGGVIDIGAYEFEPRAYLPRIVR